MASTRRRSSGFNSDSPESNESQETPNLEELFESVKEVIEAEDEAESPVLLPPPVPFVEETIVPTEDFGPRFVEEPPVEKPKEVKPLELKPAPRRQPRNVPKFSRLR